MENKPGRKYWDLIITFKEASVSQAPDIWAEKQENISHNELHMYTLCELPAMVRKFSAQNPGSIPHNIS